MAQKPNQPAWTQSAQYSPQMVDELVGDNDQSDQQNDPNDFGTSLLNALISGIKQHADQVPDQVPDQTPNSETPQTPDQTIPMPWDEGIIKPNYDSILLNSILHFSTPDNGNALDYNKIINAINSVPTQDAVPPPTQSEPISAPAEPQGTSLQPQQPTEPILSEPPVVQPSSNVVPPIAENSPDIPPAVPKPTIPSGTVLQGNGLHKFIAQVTGNDITVKGLATVFGGGNDLQDNSMGQVTDPKTGQTVTTPIGPNTIGVALPMYGSNTGSAHSPLPQLPPGTMIAVTANGRTIMAPLIDTGPTYTDDAGTGVNGSVAIDLTPALAKALGINPDPNNSDATLVTYKIIGGAQYVTPSNVKTDINPNDINPGDLSVIQNLGKAVWGNPNKVDADSVDDLAGQLRSGAFQKYVPLLGGYADNIQNANGDKEQLANAIHGIQKVFNLIHGQFMNNKVQ